MYTAYLLSWAESVSQLHGTKIPNKAEAFSFFRSLDCRMLPITVQELQVNLPLLTNLWNP